MDPQLLVALRALADASRLRLVGLLSARPMAVEELAAASGLSAGTVVHHLKRLEAAGLVESAPRHPYVEYALRADRLQLVSKELAGLDKAVEIGDELPGPDGESLPAYDAKVLRAFLRDGRLVSIPAQEKKRQAILRYLMVHCFAEDRVYSEPEVNELLGRYHGDVASLRRYLVGAGLMTRSGGEYRQAHSPQTGPAAHKGVASTTIVLIGVAGCGKSTVMGALAKRLGWATAEGDDFHSPQNVAKMRSGRPLTDDDREPWLRSLAAWIGEREGPDSGPDQNAIVTCSALKRAYRDLLRDGHPSVLFVHLVVPAVELDARLRERPGHFMPPALLASQLEILEPLGPDEPGRMVPASGALDEIVAEIMAMIESET
jgi:gluconokinase